HAGTGSRPAGRAPGRLRREERLHRELAGRHALQRMVEPGSRSSGVAWRGIALVLAALLSGCAAQMAFRSGEREGERGNWDVAVAKFTTALQKDPNNIKYNPALENARIQASRYHYTEARKHMAANDLDGAANELEIASKYDPANRFASDDLLIT